MEGEEELRMKAAGNVEKIWPGLERLVDGYFGVKGVEGRGRSREEVERIRREADDLRDDMDEIAKEKEK